MAKQELVVELYYNSTWNPVPAYVRNPATIGRERPAGSEPTPFSATVALQGIHNPKNPLSPLYGLAGQNTPIRFKLSSDVRFYGEVASWEPDRSLNYNAATGKGDAWTVVTANGILRRLGQGADPLRSGLQRLYELSSPTAFWALSEGQLSTAAKATLGSGGPFSAVQGTSVMGLADVAPWIGSGLSLSRGLVTTIVSAPVAMQPATRLVVDVTFSWDALGTSFDIFVASDKSGDVALPHWRTNVFGDGVLTYGNEGGSLGGGGNDFSGVHHIRVDIAQSGADATQTIYVDGVAKATYTDTSYTLADYTHLVLRYDDAVDPAIDSTIVLSSLALYVDITPPAIADAAAASQGYPGEQAHERIERLCAEEGIPVSIDGSASHPMGPQPLETLAALFAEIERTDDGLLYEPRATFGLAYRCGRERWNRAVVLALDWADNEVAEPFRPALDDLGSRNDVTVNRRDGATARAVLETGRLSVQEPPDGIGRYTTKIDVNTATDDVLPHHAWWHLSKGTIDGIRYDRVTVDLDASPAVAADAAAVGIGDTITIDNLPADEHPGQVRLTVLGYTETIGSHRRIITFNCVPAAVYEVGVYATDPGGVVSRYGTRDATLAAAVDADDTSWWVSTARLGARWVSGSSAPTFPFQITAGGLTYSVSEVGPSVFDSYTRSAVASWGSTSTGAQPWTVSGTASDYAVSGTEATMSLGSVGTARQAVLAGLSLEDIDHQIQVKLAAGVFPSGANVVAQLTGRRNVAGTTFYLAQLLMQPGPTLAVRLQKTVSGVTTTLATCPITRFGYGSNTYFTLRLAVIGSTVAAKAWMTSGAEPGYWDAVVTDTDITGPGAASVLGILSAGNTNTLPVVMTFDNYLINNPRQFTTVRLGAGNDKAHAVGTQISDYRPARYALGEG